MTRITVEGPVVVQLGQVVEPVEVYSEEGELLGHFTPHIPQLTRPEDQCPYTDAELRQIRARSQGQPGKSLTQMLKDLGYEP